MSVDEATDQEQVLIGRLPEGSNPGEYFVEPFSLNHAGIVPTVATVRVENDGVYLPILSTWACDDQPIAAGTRVGTAYAIGPTDEMIDLEEITVNRLTVHDSPDVDIGSPVTEVTTHQDECHKIMNTPIVYHDLTRKNKTRWDDIYRLSENSIIEDQNEARLRITRLLFSCHDVFTDNVGTCEVPTTSPTS